MTAPRVLPLAIAGIILLAAGVLWFGLQQNPSSPTGTASSSAPGAWGPLAVVPASEQIMEARIEGTIRITDACAFLDSGDLRFLLVWPSDRTTWDPVEQAVTLENGDGSSVTWQDGAQIDLGGGGLSAAEQGISASDWVSRTQWITAPGAECLIDAWWFVGERSANRSGSGG